MLDALEAQAGLVRFALAGGGDPAVVDLAAPVASCPDWSVHDLVAHLGAVNWWGGQTVRSPDPDARAGGRREVQDSAPPVAAGAAALADWYAAIAGEMIETFTEADPDTAVWAFTAPGRPDFWLRRQLHETAVHESDDLDLITVRFRTASEWGGLDDCPVCLL